MARTYFHRFEAAGRRFAIDVQTCFCFECDDISWAVLEYYPAHTITAIKQRLEGRHPAHEIDEVIGELEWLRSTKAILPPPKVEEMQQQFELNRDLHTLDLVLESSEADVPEPTAPPTMAWSPFRKRKSAQPPARRADWQTRFQAGLNLLFARSRNAPQPSLVLRPTDDFLRHEYTALAAQLVDSLRIAANSGKRLSITLRREAAPIPEEINSPLAEHAPAVEVALTHDPEHPLESGAVARRLESLAKLDLASPKALARFCQDKSVADETWVCLRPGKAALLPAVQALFQAKLTRIALELEMAYQALAPEATLALMRNLQAVAEEYAGRLLNRENIRLEPLAGLFKQIYEGKAQLRGDPTGLHRLAVDARGRLYPGVAFFGQEAFECGDIATGAYDEALLRRFEDVGALTTPDCMRCWARSLCGGGYAAAHQAWSGNFRQPDARWCDAQRSWLEAAIVAFNTLSAQGVNFTRVYDALQRPSDASVWKMLKAAWTTRIVPRPIQEADAPLLQSWENWNRAAYFLCNESGLLLATKYDREMDSLHPRGIDQEFILTRRNGAPMGLLKLSPSQQPLGLMAWIHFRDPADYRDAAIQKSFRRILDEMASQKMGQGKTQQTLFTPVAPDDAGLEGFLTALRFAPVGVQREALYLHGAYRDVALYALQLGA